MNTRLSTYEVRNYGSAQLAAPFSRFSLSKVGFSAFLLLTALAWHSATYAATYYVRPDGNNANSGTGPNASQAWATISKAWSGIPALSAGDTIYVMSGTYNETITCSSSGTFSNFIQMIGDTDGSVFGSAGGAVTIHGTAPLTIFGNYIEIEGFQLSCSSPTGTAVLVDNSNTMRLDRCEIFGGSIGVQLRFEGVAEIYNCLIRDNSNHGVKLEYFGASGLTGIIWNSTIVGASGGRGITAEAGIVFANNNIIANNAQYGIAVSGGAFVSHTYNLFHNNTLADLSGTSASTGELFVDPLFAGASDYRLLEGSPAIDSGTTGSNKGPLDLLGVARPQGAGWEMGCYEAVFFDSGLVGHWKLDETSGTTAADSSGNGNNGTVNGTTAWTSAIYGNGHDFHYADGEDYVQIPNSSTLEDVQEDSYTIAAWFKPGSIPPGADPANDANYGIVIKPGNSFGITYKYDGTFFLSHWFSDATEAYPNTPESYDPGKFYHVAGVVDRTAGTAKLYIDGELVATDAFTPGKDALELGTTSWHIGVGLPGASNWGWAADGTIDDVRIYNRALSDAEITVLYGLVGHWKLDESSGTAATDNSGVANDGAYQSTPTLGGAGPYPGDGAIAAEFDGASEYVEVPTNEVYDEINYGASVAAWVRFDQAIDDQTQQQFIVSASDWTPKEGFALFADQPYGSRIIFRVLDGSSWGEAEDYNHNIGNGEWHHVVGTYDGTTVKLYLDGQLRDTTSFSSSIAPDTGAAIQLGQQLDGRLQDVRIYDRAISDEDVTELYGLIGHWKFNESSGTAAVDSTLYGNDASFGTGTPGWVEGQRGNALDFDGSNDALSGSPFAPPDRGAIACWMYRNELNTARELLLGTANDYQVRLKNDGSLSLDLLTVSGGNFIIPPTQLGVKRWHHVVAQYDASDDTFEIYLDGQLYLADVSLNDLQSVAEGSLSFGTSASSALRFNGTLDDVRIYNRWLSAAEIADIYGLIGWWRMEETSGSAVSDSSGADNHGTVVGTGQWSTDSKEASGSIALDGTNYVQVPGIPIKSDDDGVTLAGWAKLASVDTEGAELISLGDYAVLRLDMVYSGVGTGAFTYNGAGWDEATTGRDLAGTGWHHLVMTYNASANSLKFYLNGVLQTTTSPVGNLFLDFLGNEVAIGRHGNGQATYDFNGRLDDVRLYNRAINRREARALYYGSYVNGVRIIKWIESR